MFSYDKATKRRYQLWRGNNRFFLGGRLIFGPDVRSLLLTIFLIVTPVVLFCGFVHQERICVIPPYAILVVAAVAAAYIIVLLLLTSGRDPGIIPRNFHPPVPEYDCDSSSLSSDWVDGKGGSFKVPATKDILINGKPVKIKYCQTCMLYRPPRCSHCSICNNCVERFDHHCPWVGQCVGKRSYRYFFMFVSSTTLLCLYVFIFCLRNVAHVMDKKHYNLWKALKHTPIAAFLIAYTFVTAWFVGGLTCFHLYLICTNQTTYENFRYQYTRKTNPYNRGLFYNVWEIFFAKIPSSKHNFRAKVKQDSSSAFNTTFSIGHRMYPEIPNQNFDLEMGGKRQAVDAEEFEDIQSHMERVASSERCGTELRSTKAGQKGSGEVTPDIHALAAELGTDNGLRDGEKNEGR